MNPSPTSQGNSSSSSSNGPRTLPFPRQQPIPPVSTILRNLQISRTSDMPPKARMARRPGRRTSCFTPTRTAAMPPLTPIATATAGSGRTSAAAPCPPANKASTTGGVWAAPTTLPRPRHRAWRAFGRHHAEGPRLATRSPLCTPRSCANNCW